MNKVKGDFIMVRKKKINPKSLSIIVLILVLILGGLWGSYILIDRHIQQMRHEKIEEVLKSRQETLDQINAWQNTRGIDQEAFDALKAEALADNASAYKALENLEEKRVDQKTYDQAVALDLENDGLRYMNLYNDPGLPEEYLVFLSRDDDRLAFVSQYHVLNGHTTPPATLTESLDTIPHLLQWDERWGYMPYGTSNMVIAGCAPTSLSMILSYLNQDPTLTPYAIAQFSESNGHYVDGVGTAHSLVDAAAQNYGVQVEGIPVDEASIDQALSEGKLLLVSVNPGHFTRVGHFIVITGLENGQYNVLDPNSYKNTRLWDKSVILNEAASIWAFWK